MAGLAMDMSRLLVVWTIGILHLTGTAQGMGQHYYREEYSPQYRSEYRPEYSSQPISYRSSDYRPSDSGSSQYRTEYSPQYRTSQVEYSPQSNYRSEARNDYSPQYRNVVSGSSSSSGSRGSSGDPCYPSPCGEGAICEVRNSIAVCKCPQDYLGNAFTRCYPECTSHQECPGHLACFGLKCKDPCVGACGRNANCEVNRSSHKAVCSCPKDHGGHPFDECRPFGPADLCSPNPCGTSANCQPGHDNTGKERPVCTCPTGYTGDPLRYCYRG